MLKLTGHKGDVRTVAFAPDGRLVSGGGDKTVRIWNPTTGECLTTIKAGTIVYAVAVSPDGQVLAWAGKPASPRDESNFVHLGDLAGKSTGRYEVQTYGMVWRRDHPAISARQERQRMARTIWGLSFSADGKYLAAAVRKPGAANIPDGAGGFYWALGASGASGASSEAHALPGDNIYAVAFAPAGHTLAVTRESSVLFLPGPEAAEEVTYPLAASWSPAVAFVPGAELAVVASNSFIEFLNPFRREKSKRVKTGSRSVVALAVSPDGKTPLAGGRPGAVEVYDTATRAKKTEYDFGVGGLQALAYAPDGLTFAAAGDEGLVVCDASG